MKIFLDTANVAEIKEMVELKMIDGVTTNPSLLAKEGKDHMKVLKEIVSVVKGPVNVEPVNPTLEGILSEAEEFAKLGKNVVIKIPFTKDGLKAQNILSKKGMQTSFTLIFSVNQAIIAAKTGVNYIIPFIGRLDDGGQYGTEMTATIMQVYANYNFKTEVIAASVRTALHVVELAVAGVDIVTAPKNVIELMIKHPLTDLGVKKFVEDWEKAHKK